MLVAFVLWLLTPCSSRVLSGMKPTKQKGSATSLLHVLLFVARKKRIKKKKLRTFQEKLTALGFSSYEAYQRSSWWKRFRSLYAAEHGLPKQCLACGSKDFQLHHITYKRLGRELLTDVIPLCGDHHLQIHDVHKHYPIGLDDFESALRIITGDPSYVAPSRVVIHKPKHRAFSEQASVKSRPIDWSKVAFPEGGNKAKKPSHDERKAKLEKWLAAGKEHRKRLQSDI